MEKTWLLPFTVNIAYPIKCILKFCIIYRPTLVNTLLSRYCDLADLCSFCNTEIEDVCHFCLFFIFYFFIVVSYISGNDLGSYSFFLKLK